MLKSYFLTTKSNLMTKFKMNGKSMVMVLSFFAFMILGSVSASAQIWVSPDEAALIIKDHVTTLENDFSNASTTQEKLDIAFEIKYFTLVKGLFNDAGLEVPEAVLEAKPVDKAKQHSSGLIYFDSDSPNLRAEADALVALATDLLSN